MLNTILDTPEEPLDIKITHTQKRKTRQWHYTDLLSLQNQIIVSVLLSKD